MDSKGFTMDRLHESNGEFFEPAARKESAWILTIPLGFDIDIRAAALSI